MSSIIFDNLVEKLLNESVTQDLTPRTGESSLDSLGAVASFINKLVFREGGYMRQDTLITYKPIWPYADTFDYIRAELARTGVIKNDREGVNILARALSQNPETVQDLITALLPKNQDIQISENSIKAIQDKIQYLKDNKDNYRSYYNTVLKQLNDETSIIAAEDYLGLTPQESIVQVLQDFGGYDVRTAERIIMFPGENRYTQMGPNVGGVVMGSIVEISKLILTFYRETVQQYSKQILGLFEPILQENGITGVKPQNISQAAMAAGKEATPTDFIQNYVKKDYIAFLNGMSSLVLANYPEIQASEQGNKPEPNQTQLNQQNVNYGRNAPRIAPPSSTKSANNSTDTFHGPSAAMGDSLNVFDKFYNKVFIQEAEIIRGEPLVKTINDFRGMPGTGQQVFQAYLHLFNNMREGEIPSKWETGAKTGVDILGGIASGLTSTFGKFRGL